MRRSDIDVFIYCHDDDLDVLHGMYGTTWLGCSWVI